MVERGALYEIYLTAARSLHSDNAQGRIQLLFTYQCRLEKELLF